MKTGLLYQYILELFTFEYDFFVWLHIKEERGRDGEWGTDEQPLSNMPPLDTMWRKLQYLAVGHSQMFCVKCKGKSGSRTAKRFKT